MSDPELPGYLPFAAESTGWTVWMPAGTWRATPWLLRLARQAEVKMLWLVDDNVRAVQVSYVDCVEETYTLSTMPKAQFLRFFCCGAQPRIVLARVPWHVPCLRQ